METFLLTWNPRRFDWDDFEEVFAEVAEHGSAVYSWSCGNTRRILPGDRLFLIRQGKDQPGLVGSAWAMSRPYQEQHWEDQEGRSPSRAWYIAFDWDVLSRDPIVPRSRLDQPPFDVVNWSSQSSGISIRPDVAAALEAEWSRRTGHAFCALPEEAEAHDLLEGQIRRISVDRFERDGKARRACIEHYGCECAACGLTLSSVYGDVAAHFIHVHHLLPLASVRRRHRVDPIRDLRPVCPNCHAVIHLKSPPFSIDEVRALVEGRKT